MILCLCYFKQETFDIATHVANKIICTITIVDPTGVFKIYDKKMPVIKATIPMTTDVIITPI